MSVWVPRAAHCTIEYSETVSSGFNLPVSIWAWPQANPGPSMELDRQGIFIFIISISPRLLDFSLKHRRTWSILKLIFGRHLQGSVVATWSQAMEGMLKSLCVADWLEPKGDGGLARLGWPRSTLSAPTNASIWRRGRGRGTKHKKMRAQSTEMRQRHREENRFQTWRLRKWITSSQASVNYAVKSDLSFQKRDLIRT